MEGGDLSTWRRNRIVVVVEGVLCSRKAIVKRRRFRNDLTDMKTEWHETPMKRLVFMRNHFAEMTSIDLVTFISDDFEDETGEYLAALGVDYDSLSYHPFDMFCAKIRFDIDVQAIYDSEPDRLSRYGQRGVSVVRGADF